MLRRAAFLAVLVTGLALCASAVHGVSGMDTSLELAASTPERTTFVSHRPPPPTGCPGYDDGREHRRLA